MLRLERHHMRLSLSYANATNPLHYSPDAFRALMEQAELYKNPTLFGHDTTNGWMCPRAAMAQRS